MLVMKAYLLGFGLVIYNRKLKYNGVEWIVTFVISKAVGGQGDGSVSKMLVV